MLGKPLPKIAFLQNMRNRTLSVYSAGKIFSATGMRSGWVIGPTHLMRAVKAVHQHNVFCFYNVVENAAAKSVEEIAKPTSTYLKDFADKFCHGRDIMVK